MATNETTNPTTQVTRLFYTTYGYLPTRYIHVHNYMEYIDFYIHMYISVILVSQTLFLLLAHPYLKIQFVLINLLKSIEHVILNVLVLNRVHLMSLLS